MCSSGATCHLPTAIVLNPASASISATVAAAWVIRPRPLGKPLSKLDSMRMPTLWWLRPVSTLARVGEHSGEVWKLVYRSPEAASRSIVGVSISAPKQPKSANPTSSSNPYTTFGVPAAADGGALQCSVDSP